jgi:multidrug resistance efflux pump
MLRSIAWVVVLMLLLALGAVVYLGVPKTPTDETQVVSVGMVKRSVKGLGRVEGVAESNLSFGRPGRLDTVLVTEGQEVDINDVIAEMNPAEVDAQVEEAQTDLKTAKAKLELVKAQRPPQVIQQSEEKLQQATDEIKAARARLKALEDPPTPPPPTASQIEEQTFVIAKEQQNVALAQAALKQLKSSPTSDELAIAAANLKEAQTEVDGAVRKSQDVKPGGVFTGGGSSFLKTDAQVAVDRAQAHLELVQAQYDRVKRGPRPEEIEAATARVALAQIQLDSARAYKARLEKPEKPAPAPAYEIEAARVALMQAMSRENAARAAVDELKRGPEPAEVHLAEAAVEKAVASLGWLKKSREGLKLRAPFAGLITHRYIEPGNMITGTSPVLTIVDFTQKRVRAEFDILRLGEIKQGMHVDLSSRALGKETLDGKIEKILGVGSRKLTNDDPAAPKGGEVAEMIITLDEPKSDLKKQAFAVLRPGLRMDADVTLDKRDNVIIAPKAFVSQTDGKEYVLGLERKAGPNSSDTITVHYVTTGMRDEQYVEIRQGLSEGDVIVKPRTQNSH